MLECGTSDQKTWTRGISAKKHISGLSILRLLTKPSCQCRTMLYIVVPSKSCKSKSHFPVVNQNVFFPTRKKFIDWFDILFQATRYFICNSNHWKQDAALVHIADDYWFHIFHPWLNYFPECFMYVASIWGLHLRVVRLVILVLSIWSCNEFWLVGSFRVFLMQLYVSNLLKSIILFISIILCNITILQFSIQFDLPSVNPNHRRVSELSSVVFFFVYNIRVLWSVHRFLQELADKNIGFETWIMDTTMSTILAGPTMSLWICFFGCKDHPGWTFVWV